MTKIPENSHETASPDDLQQTTYTCGCGDQFETAHKLGLHSVDCEECQTDPEDLGVEE